MTIRENYEQWLKDFANDPETVKELEAIRDDQKELEDRFYTELSFGTAGMRGVLGAGTNRMNVHVVGKASQGLADYLNAAGDAPSVVIGYDSRINSELFAQTAAGVFAALIGLHNAGSPTAAQMKNAERWLVTWGFNDDMIIEAYERCVNKKGEFSMSYMNGILKKWYEKRIFSPEALKTEEDAASKRSSKKGSAKGSVFSEDGASFSLSQFESKSLFDD